MLGGHTVLLLYSRRVGAGPRGPVAMELYDGEKQDERRVLFFYATHFLIDKQQDFM